jgi:preprotein translocase subunit SecA
MKRVPILLLQEKEFLKMFQIPVLEVPTNLPNIRNDLPIQAFAVGQQNYFLILFNVCFIST